MTARLALASVAAMVAWCATFTACAHADATPSLADAHAVPSWSYYLHAGRSVAPRAAAVDGTPCPHAGYFSDVQAYRWTRIGWDSEGPQRWTRDGLSIYWRHAGASRRVTYNGVSFHNGTHHAVLVAGWCG